MSLEKDFSIIAPKGKLDTISAPDFGKELAAIFEENVKGCIVNLSDVSFLSSSGLQALLVGAKVAKNKDVKYGVCGMNEMVNDVFTLSGFDRFILTFSDEKEALAKL